MDISNTNSMTVGQVLLAVGHVISSYSSEATSSPSSTPKAPHTPTTPTSSGLLDCSEKSPNDFLSKIDSNIALMKSNIERMETHA